MKTKIVVVAAGVALAIGVIWYVASKTTKAIPSPGKGLQTIIKNVGETIAVTTGETLGGVSRAVVEAPKQTVMSVYEYGKQNPPWTSDIIYAQVLLPFGGEEKVVAKKSWTMLGEGSKSFLADAPWKADPTMFASLPDGGAFARAELERLRAKQVAAGNIPK